MGGESPNGPALCIHDDGPPIEAACENPYCHACSIEFDRWVMELTDDKPYND